jgi:hypothetical protein
MPEDAVQYSEGAPGGVPGATPWGGPSPESARIGRVAVYLCFSTEDRRLVPPGRAEGASAPPSTPRSVSQVVPATERDEATHDWSDEEEEQARNPDRHSNLALLGSRGGDARGVAVARRPAGGRPSIPVANQPEAPQEQEGRDHGETKADDNRTYDPTSVLHLKAQGLGTDIAGGRSQRRGDTRTFAVALYLRVLTDDPDLAGKGLQADRTTAAEVAAMPAVVGLRRSRTRRRTPSRRTSRQPLSRSRVVPQANRIPRDRSTPMLRRQREATARLESDQRPLRQGRLQRRAFGSNPSFGQVRAFRKAFPPPIPGPHFASRIGP